MTRVLQKLSALGQKLQMAQSYSHRYDHLDDALAALVENNPQAREELMLAFLDIQALGAEVVRVVEVEEFAGIVDAMSQRNYAEATRLLEKACPPELFARRQALVEQLYQMVERYDPELGGMYRERDDTNMSAEVC